jgi:threonine aldolase
MGRAKKRGGGYAGDPLTVAERDALWDVCDRSLWGNGKRTPAQHLAEMANLDADLVDDRYGDGGVVTVLENEVRAVLDKPAAVFMPSGTMIQQIALRIHSDRRGSKVVAFHPTCHLELHEDKAYQRLHGLVGLTVGSRRELITLADLQRIREPVAALLLELPQREIGGQLPSWADLKTQTKWARDRGAAVHMDGARLWECGPFYDRPLKEIAALFDTAYVSFYKGLDGTGGGMLLGDEDVIAEAREWRHRHGGTIYNMWPYAASDLAGFRLRLPRMPKYVKHARRVAAALAEIDAVEISPDPPQTPMMHLYLRTTPEAFNAGVRRLALEHGIWTWAGSQPADVPGYRKVELYCGDATLQFAPDEVAAAVSSLIG